MKTGVGKPGLTAVVEALYALYARISEDRSGEALGVADQLDDERQLVKQRGGTVVGEYADNDLSALKGGPRPEYQRLMADVDAGLITHIVVWHTSRLWRNRRERAEGIERLKAARVSVVAVKGPELDMTTAYGRGIAGLVGEFDTLESEVKSERVARAARRRAEQGLNHGARRCYGYGPVVGKDGQTGKPIRDYYQLIPEEADQVARMAEQLLGGVPLGTIIRQLNDRPVVAYLLEHRDLLADLPEQERKVFDLRHVDGLDGGEVAQRLGITTTVARRTERAVLKRHLAVAVEWAATVGGFLTVSGNMWERTTVRDLLRSPRIAGLSEHRGVIVGKGKWPAIIAEDQHHAIVALVNDPSRRTTTGNRANYLMTGIATCGVCGASINSAGMKTSRPGSKRFIYRCRANFCMSRRRDWVDDYVTERVFERLRRPDAADLLIDRDRPDMEVLRGAAHAIRLQLDAAAASFARDAIDDRQLEIITKGLNERLGEIREQQQHTSRAPILRELIEAGDKIEAVWKAMDLDRKRAVVGCLMDVVLHPGGSGHKTFDPTKVEIIPKA